MGDFSIGADPEFCFVSRSGKHIAANTLVEHGSSSFGVDGAGGPAELRPQYAYGPKDLVKNIRSTMLNALLVQPYLRHFRWVAGYHAGYATGGHIHIGLKSADASTLCKAIDVCVSYPMRFFFSQEEYKKRCVDSGYGRFGDVRSDHPHGHEIRSPGSWLSCPQLASGALCAAYVAADAVRLGKPNGIAVLWESLRAAHVTKENRNAVIGWLREAPLYEQYKDEIDWFMTATDQLGGVDMKETWGLASLLTKPILKFAIKKGG